MTNPSSQHDTLAQRLAELLATLPQVEAVAMGGSLSAGAADEHSDLDLEVYTSSAVDPAARKALFGQADQADQGSMGLDYWGPSDEWVDPASGIGVDCSFFDAGWMEGQLRRVIEEHRPSLGYTTCFWRTVRHSRPLYDRGGWLASIQALAQTDYPDQLRRNIIAHNYPVLRELISSYLKQLEKALRRDDRVSLNHRVAALLASYFDIVFALNRVLHPGEKRLIAYVERECPLRPEGMAHDIHTLLELAGRADQRLIAQTHTLIDRLQSLLEQAGINPHS
jgi:hypothetical protein